MKSAFRTLINETMSKLLINKTHVASLVALIKSCSTVVHTRIRKSHRSRRKGSPSSPVNEDSLRKQSARTQPLRRIKFFLRHHTLWRSLINYVSIPSSTRINFCLFRSMVSVVEESRLCQNGRRGAVLLAVLIR